MKELYNALNSLSPDEHGSGDQLLAYDIQRQILSYFDNTTDWNWTGTYASIAEYPTNLNVPEGAAQVTWSGTGFEYVTNATVGAPDKTLNVYNLCYPASLAYFVNTPLKATTEKNVSWPTSASDWKSEGWTGWTGAVAASTQTVALQNNIQYGVANLNTTVKCATSTLEDNASVVVPGKYSANQHIVVPSDGFPVTGLLVGGQPDFASWDMTPLIIILQ